MEKKKYSEKLRDPRWQKLRLEIFERDEWCCQKCFDTESTLAVHHLRYIPGLEPWEYLPGQLLTLCEECHSHEYEIMPDAIDSLIDQVKDKGFLSDDVRLLASGINGLRLTKPPEVMAAIIEFALRNDHVFTRIEEMYFTALAESREKKQ